MSIVAAIVPSPLGALRLVASERGLRRVGFDPQRWPVDETSDAADLVLPGSHPVIARTTAALEAYFAGHAEPFDLPLDLPGLTPFQRSVIEAMRAVPYGALTTYGALAEDVDRPAASRAVGQVCNINPVPIVVPCHRIVAADGSLGGYAAGTEVKRHLLELERGSMVPLGGWEPRAARERHDADALRLF